MRTQMLRAQKFPQSMKNNWLKRLRWYKRCAYDGEFCFDFVCACDLLCWARDNFDRMGDKYPGDNPPLVSMQLCHATKTTCSE